MTRIYLVRHGQSTANLEGVLTARDAPLTALGQEQAAATSEWLSRRPAAAVYSSPFRRALDTAGVIASRLGLEVTIASELSEFDVGELAGRSDAEAWAIYDGIGERWEAGDWQSRFPGGESLIEAYQRIAEFFAQLSAAHPEQEVVAVGHGGVTTAVVPRLVKPAIPSQGIANCAITVLEGEGGSLQCVLWADVEHLQHVK